MSQGREAAAGRGAAADRGGAAGRGAGVGWGAGAGWEAHIIHILFTLVKTLEVSFLDVIKVLSS